MKTTQLEQLPPDRANRFTSYIHTKYPKLCCFLKNEHISPIQIDLILGSIERHFKELLDLPALEGSFDENDKANSYQHFFTQLILPLYDKYTEQEIVYTLYAQLNSPSLNTISPFFNNRLLIKLNGSLSPLDAHPKQIGYLEKMAACTLRGQHEPLTMLDMLRYATYLKTSYPNTQVSVYELSDWVMLQQMQQESAHVSSPSSSSASDLGDRFIFIDFNQQPNQSPKWGVYDRHEHAVYCEVALTENEKSILEQAVLTGSISYQVGKAGGNQSTGFYAAAKLKKLINASQVNLPNAANTCEVNEDFFTLREQFVRDISQIDKYEFFSDKDASIPAVGDFLFFRKNLEFENSEAIKHLESLQISGIPRPNKSEYAKFFPNSRKISFATLAICGSENINAFLKARHQNWRDQSDCFYLPEEERKRIIFSPYKFSFAQAEARVIRKCIPYLDTLMVDHHYLQIGEGNDPTRLVLQDNKIGLLDGYQNVGELIESYLTLCNPADKRYIYTARVNIRWEDLCNIADAIGYQNWHSFDSPTMEELMIAMLLSVFRTQYKKTYLSIEIPQNVEVGYGDIHYIIGLVEVFNPYLTQLDISNNVSLQNLRVQLQPFLARNRWLAHNNYKPPLMDNYWKVAARYWMEYYSENNSILTHTDENQIFKESLRDTGLLGLEHFLIYLQTDANEIKQQAGKKQYTFYVPAVNENVDQRFYGQRYTEQAVAKIVTHLHEKHYFPFNKIAISCDYHSEHQFAARNFIENVFEPLYAIEQFDTILLIDILNANPQAMQSLLNELIQDARKNSRQKLVAIPELNDESQLNHAQKKLLNAYRHLNNIILNNRRNKKRAQQIALLAPSMVEPIKDGKSDKGKEDWSKDEARGIEISQGIESWPISRGGAQLQLQLQQQLHQQMQQQVEYKDKAHHEIDDALPDDLIDYGNIENKLGGYYADLVKQGVIPPAQDLQQQFLRWINALKPAEHVIHSMTTEAAKALIRKPRGLASGLNLENLPKGFYTQRTKAGHLVLFYKPEKGYVTEPNPLTIDLNATIPKAEKWLGDFRQFDIDHYIEKISSARGKGKKRKKEQKSYTFEEKDYRYLALFAMLQPQNTIGFEFAAFKKEYLKPLNLTPDNWEQIQNHWFIFSQMWALNGKGAVPTFLEAVERGKFNLSVDAAIQLLHLDSNLPFLQAIEKKEKFLRILGQVYYQYGWDVTSVLCQKLQAIYAKLGEDFFRGFCLAFINDCENVSYLLSEESIKTLNKMIERLASDPSTKQNFQYIMQKHAEAECWEDVNTLWKGYIYFTEQLDARGLYCAENQFKNIAPQNMLVCMDRVLYCLDHIPEAEQQQRFLHYIAEGKVDLSHAGAFYALVYERFNSFSPALELRDFYAGCPTYHPPFAALYEWKKENVALFTQRLLATQSQLSQQEYYVYAEFFAGLKLDKSEEYCNLLVFLLLTQPIVGLNQDPLEHIQSVINTIASAQQTAIARKLHAIATQTHPIQALAIDIDTIAALAQLQNIDELLALPDPLCKIALEIAAVLYAAQKNVTSDQLVLQELKNFKHNDLDAIQLLKIHFLLGNFPTIKEFNEKLAEFRSSPLAAKQEARILFKQLLSIDWQKSDINALREEWVAFNTCLNTMSATPASTRQIRIAFVQQLKDDGIVFRGTLSGTYRQLDGQDKRLLKDLSFFVDHHTRLWNFLKKHVLIVDGDNPQQALQPLLNIFKQLQTKRGILNEIEPLLAILEKTDNGQYWTAEQFAAIMQTLNVTRDDDTLVYYPVSLLGKVLETKSLKARRMDVIVEEQPVALLACIKEIASDTHLTMKQKTILCQIADKEWRECQATERTQAIFNAIKDNPHVTHPAYTCLLEYMVTLKTIEEIDTTFSDSNLAVFNGNAGSLDSYALWFAHFKNPRVRIAFNEVKNKSELLKIIAFSTLDQGLKTDHEQQNQLRRKLTKLVAQLKTMSPEDVTLLSKCYPARPSPTADDILRLIKRKQRRHITWEACLQAFECQPFTQSFMDKDRILANREVDIIRILDELRITYGDTKRAATGKDMTRISRMLKQLKDLEAGKIFIDDERKPLAHMTQQEIQEAFARLSVMSAKNRDNDQLNIQIWALLFTALGRTTRKYPHLAQQVALIANDVCLTSDMRLLQLDTGEGKSHFIALRAARYAGMGKTVDICTAKESLALRDHADYKDFLHYMGIPSSYVHARAEREDYWVGKGINFCTTGGLSLFFDRHLQAGNPIHIDPRNRVGLFDEFDFIRFGKLQYNFAIANERTPKKMHWFYQALNLFYATKLSQKATINIQDINEFIRYLSSIANHNKEKEEFIEILREEPLLCVQWLQSAYEAARLEQGKDFTVVYTDVAVGKEDILPMREIIPLSTDNQKMFGSTFSLGVHQLLAERLNAEAVQKGEPQNYYVLPESDIINSQVASFCMQHYWLVTEGFSGTISTQQAAQLHYEHSAQVLHVPTNRPCLRAWQPPQFFDNENEQINALVIKLRECLAQQKSILFACKNDNAVKFLEQQLKAYLSEDELQQLIFYTNEETKTPQEILEEKHQKEDWQAGKKTRGIGLIASGFGRGDNCGVEVVFLMDANNENDRRQKGGRTGRNGSAGEVYEFYLRKELQAEEHELRERCAQLVPKNFWSRILKHLNEVPGANKDEKQRYRVLLLREHVENLMNASRDAYQAMLAEYCCWGMNILAALKPSKDTDPYTALEWKWKQSLQNIEKARIEITADANKNTEQKIAAIAQVIQKSIKTVFISENQQGFTIQIPKPVIQDLVLVKEETTRNYQEGESAMGKDTKDKLEEKEGVLDGRLTEEQRKTLINFTKRYPVLQASITNAIRANPEVGLGYLQEWEQWVRDKSTAEQEKFINHFCQVMEKYFNAGHFDGFAILVQQTNEWWGKGDKGQYQSDLLTLWERLAHHPVNEAVIALITQMMSVHDNGKLGFLAFSACLRLEPAVLAHHYASILEKFQTLTAPVEDEEAGEKKQKKQHILAELNTFIDGVAYCSAKGLDLRWLEIAEADFVQLKKQLNKFDKLSLQQGDESPQMKMRTFLNAMNADARERLAFLNLFYTNKEIFKKYPQLINTLFGYINKPELAEITLQTRIAICEILMRCVAVTFNPQLMIQLIADYQTFITSIQALDDEGIRESLTLFPELVRLPTMLFDLLKNGVVTYYRGLAEPDKALKQAAVKRVVNYFTGEIFVKQGDVEQMFDQGAAINNLFDFSKQHIKTDRILFMQMLYQRRFVVTHDAPLLSWTAEQNNALLKKGFTCYITEAEKIVDQPKKLSTKNKHDLSADQETKLLALSHELEVIGAVAPANASKDNQETINTLQTQLTTIKSRYKTGFFNRVNRKESFHALQNAINTLGDVPAAGGNKNRYQTILKTINEIKCRAMTIDCEANKKRTFFAVNRKGYSELHHTLNQMHDCVVRHWLQDEAAIHKFQAYTAIAAEQFKTILHGLKQEVDAFSPTIFGKDIPQEFKNALTPFYNPGDANVADNNITIAHLTALQQAIIDHKASLPSHIHAWAEEVIKPTEVLLADKQSLEPPAVHA